MGEARKFTPELGWLQRYIGGMSAGGRIWIGTSGYVYRHWRKGVFYPPALKSRDELPYYARNFPTVELNNPFYRLPTGEMFARWRAVTPEDFRFAVKGSRFITHIKRLRDCGDEIELFLSRAEHLGPKLGPMLFQLPPNQQLDLPRLAKFLPLLSPQHRWVLEFRHASWHTTEVYRLLAQHAVALCIPVGGGLHPDRVTTASFSYIRMHRGQEPGGGFLPDDLRVWARQLRGLASVGKDVYIYFNNDWEGYAIRDAMLLQGFLGLTPVPDPALEAIAPTSG
jgi:uncharacterized protein YecE (DUF72 family)